MAAVQASNGDLPCMRQDQAVYRYRPLCFVLSGD
jgi:hypothetical protein